MAAGVFTVETDASLTLDAAVHLVIDERPEILIAKRSLTKLIYPRAVTRHHRHVLQVAFTAFIAHGTIMGMIEHQALNHGGAKIGGLGILDRNACTFRRRRHAGHYELAGFVVLVSELFDR